MEIHEIKLSEMSAPVDYEDRASSVAVPEVQKPELANEEKAKYNRPWVIYTLSSPLDGIVRYVGFTSDRTVKRMSAHLSNARRGVDIPVYRWIRKLLKAGLKPDFSVIESGVGAIWRERERYWIAKYRGENGSLMLNCSDGVEGTIGVCHTPQSRMKLSLSLKGRKLSDDARRNIALAKMGDKNPNFGKSPSAETSAKKSAAQKGRKWSVETRAKISASKQNISEETKRRLSESGKNMDPEKRAKITAASIAARRGQKMSARTSIALWNNNKKSRALQCVEAGVCYYNMRDAATDLGINYSTLKKGIKLGMECRGFNFVMIDRHGFKEQ